MRPGFGVRELLYLVLACGIAAAGLVSNNKEAVVGSMMIAPFFAAISDAPYTVATLAVISALTIGFGVVVARALRMSRSFETDEMRARAEWDTTARVVTLSNYAVPLLAGAAIALATPVEGDVAIAGASIAVAILPPLVNAGLYYGSGRALKGTHSVRLGLTNIVLGALAFYATQWGVHNAWRLKR